jgi:hypothetical protein
MIRRFSFANTQEAFMMTILDPRTGQLVTINLTSKPRRRA